MSDINSRIYSKVIIAGLCLFRGFFITGCVSQATIKNQNLLVFQKRINEFVYDGFSFKMGGTRSEIIRALGTPIRITKKEVINVHDPEQVDVKNVLFYDGLSIKIYRVSETGREIITGISVTADEYKLKWGLSIGCTQDDLKKQLGEPYEEDNNTYVYQTDDAPSIVVFYIRNSNVYQIDWEFYYD
jgi:hypothetical protein